MAPSLAYLLTQFAPAGDHVALFREDISTETFWLGYHAGASRYPCFAFTNITVGGKTIHIIVRMQMRRALVNRTENDAGVTTSGTWTNSASALVYGGDSDWADLFGEYKEITTPAGVTAVGVRGLHTTNAGMAKCSIDGDTTLCDLLPTAQQLVDGGTLASTALVANGGNLNPTDRILDQYRSVGAEVVTMLSESLTAGAHVIRFAPTGYKRTASSDIRAYLAAFFWLQPGHVQDLTATGIDLAFEADIGRVGGGSFYDYTFHAKPTGSGSAAFIGGGHGQDQQTDLDLLLNGSPHTFSGNREYTGGTSASLTRTSQLFHADVGAGATVVADITSVFTAHKDNGLISNHTIDWQQSMDITAAYIGMLPANQLLIDKANNNVGGAADETLTANDASVYANQQGQMLYAWDADGIYGAALYVPDLAVVNNYANDTNRYLWIEDGSGDNKIYLTRMQLGTVTAASQWGPGEVRYLAQWFASADTALNQSAGATGQPTQVRRRGSTMPIGAQRFGRGW